MIVLHVAETIKGGVATILNQHIKFAASDERLSRIIFLVPANQKQYLDKTAVFNEKVEFRYFTGNTRSQRIVSLFFALIRLRVKLKIDSVHLHSTFAGLAGRIAFMFSNCFVVYQPHGIAFDPDRVGNGPLFYAYLSAEWILSSATDTIVAISAYEHRLLDNIKLNCRLMLITNGVEKPCSRPEPTSRTDDLVFVGRLDKQKGLDILLQHWPAISNGRKLLVAGEAVVSDADNKIYGSDLSNVKFLGWLDQGSLAQVIRGCFGVVVPSRWEGFGLVAAEALSLGTPIIVSDRGALPEIATSEVGAVFSLSNVQDSFPAAIDVVERLYEAGNLNDRCSSICNEKFNAVRAVGQITDLHVQGIMNRYG